MNFDKIFTLLNSAIDPLIPNLFLKKQPSTSSTNTTSNNINDKVTSDKYKVQIQVYQQPKQHEDQHDQQQEDKQQQQNIDLKYLDDLNSTFDDVVVDEFSDSGCSSDSDFYDSEFEETTKKKRPKYFDYPFRKKDKNLNRSNSSLFSAFSSSSLPTFTKDNNRIKSLRRLFKNSRQNSFTKNTSSPTTNSVYPTNGANPELRGPLVFSPPNPEPSVPLWSEQVDPEVKKSMNPMGILRQEVIFEIIRTEKEFVEDIKFLLEHYASAILDSDVRVPKSLNQALHVLHEIYYLHKDSSRQLLNLQAIYPVVPSISHVLSNLAAHLGVYDRFLHHHKDAISQIAIARKKANKFGQLIGMLEANNMNSGRYCSIESLMTKPIQRLCKYPLLVTTLMRATSPDDQDYPQLRLLHEKLDSAIRELHQERDNRAKKELEQLSRKLSLGLGFMATPFSGRASSMSLRNHKQNSNPNLNNMTTPLSTSLRAS
ncbi:8047_t:CDS:2 [Ambispora gerdemannii]|uniref:8047_t:CDS:1 n=1 Tax=Ambispora gerdemannii TaxID=144530 RepID=A0A9N8YPG3_9GLOM|nr:8047_t:CDS:2 [Ambispora gerdemannii]